jgi:hypothetical protein
MASRLEDSIAGANSPSVQQLVVSLGNVLCELMTSLSPKRSLGPAQQNHRGNNVAQTSDFATNPVVHGLRLFKRCKVLHIRLRLAIHLCLAERLPQSLH